MKINSYLRSTIATAIAHSIRANRQKWVWSCGGRLRVTTGRRPQHSVLVCRICGHYIARS